MASQPHKPQSEETRKAAGDRLREAQKEGHKKGAAVVAKRWMSLKQREMKLQRTLDENDRKEILIVVPTAAEELRSIIRSKTAKTAEKLKACELIFKYGPGDRNVSGQTAPSITINLTKEHLKSVRAISETPIDSSLAAAGPPTTGG